MLTRKLMAAVVLTAVLATACGDDPFGVEDALGIWDAEELNGRAVPGDVWVYDVSGDSIEIFVEALDLEFMASSDCSFTVDLEGQLPNTPDECTYAVGEDGDISVTVEEDYDLTGTSDGNEMTLTDEDTNVWVLRRRTTAPAPVASVEVTPLADTVRAGESIQLAAIPKDAAGNPVRRRTITWASDDETVATVDNTGLVTGENSGAATITATSEGHDGMAEVTVWVGVTGSWSGTLDVPGGPCRLDLSITEAGTGTITGTSQLFAPCAAMQPTVTGTNHTGGVTDSVVMAFSTAFGFKGMFDGDATMTGAVDPGPHPATITRQSLSPAPPAQAAPPADIRSRTVVYPWPRRTPSGR